MARAQIPVDLFNPGQVFACLGFLEAADVLLGDAEGGFDWGGESRGEPVRFVLEAAGESDPVAEVLRFLAEARIEALSPLGSGRADTWGAETVVDPDGVFPVSPTVKENNKRIWLKESALPIRLVAHGCSLSVSHWSDVDNGREPLKMWGGDAGKPGAARMRDLLNAVRDAIQSDLAGAAANPLNLAAPVGGFRLEMRRDYVPMDIGFSLNEHKTRMSARGFPLVEVLAVVGLENARPTVVDRLRFRYGAWGALLCPPLARAMLGCAQCGAEVRTFVTQLGEPNEYARSILHAQEEPQR